VSDLMLDPDEVRAWWEEAGDDPRRMAEIATANLRERAANGDINAEIVLNDWTMAGAIQRLKKSRQSLRQVVLPRASGEGTREARLPVVMSLARPEGRQMVAWETLTYTDFRRFVDAYRSQYRTRAQNLQVFDRLDAVWSQHQDLLGSDALRLIGIDPAEMAEAAA
jgi:hypothetical protein